MTSAIARLREEVATGGGLKPLRVMAASGQLGYGIPDAAFNAGLARKPHLIGADMGSIDPGPYYLGAGKMAQSETMVRVDLAKCLRGARQLGIPLLVGTAGSAGAAPHLAQTLDMVRAIARATVEQAKGSKQVTDAIGRIAETVQQIAAATAQQARGSELIMKSAEKMRTITQHVERSSQEQARGGRQITGAIEQISNMVNTLNASQRSQTRGGEQLLEAARRIDEAARAQDQALRQLAAALERLRRATA